MVSIPKLSIDDFDTCHVTVMFDLQGGDLSQGWRKYVSRFENLMLAMNITNATRKKAMLLHYAGEEVNEIFETLDVQEADENEDIFKKAEKALRNYFTPQKNLEFEVYKFRQAKQLPGEDISAYYTRLKQLAKSCEFHDEKRELKTQIIQNGISTKLRRKALADPEITLEKILQIAKAMELSEVQAEGIESVNQLTKKVNHREVNNQKANDSQLKSKCRYCGYQHVLGKKNCPADGKQCRGCQKWNHFKVCCNDKREESKRNERSKFSKRSEQSKFPKRNEQLANTSKRTRCVNNLNEDKVESSSEEEYVFSTSTVSAMSCQKLPNFKVRINGTPLTVMADTGASVNLLDEVSFAKLRTKPRMTKTNEKIFPYGSNKPLALVGKCCCEVETKTKFSVETFFVVEGKTGCLVSWKSSQRLGLVQVVQSVEQSESNRVESLVESYSDLFQGLGKLKGFQVQLHVDKDVQPIAQSHRRVPFHVRKHLEEQLRCDEELGVIENTEGPTPWVSPVVVVPKKEGKIRVCVDMRQVNKCIRRERHVTPTINEVITDLNGAKVFSKLDLNQGYNQLELAPESRYLTTFSTYLGLRRFRRLNFGINCAAEIFQNAIREALSGLKGVVNISDDILVYGTDDDDHYTNLEAALQRIRERGLTLNKEKCIFKKRSLIFQGYVFSERGVSPDPAKVAAIQEFITPNDASEVRSLLGMTNFCCRVIKNYATLTAPLRELTKKNVPFLWTKKQERALAMLRDILTNAPENAYFDSTKITEVFTDASPVGVAAVLTQKEPESEERKIIAYASRALTSTEQNYSQLEREALAIIWSCEHFHLYLYGGRFSVFTDHQPLVAIFSNPASKPSAHLERWSLRLQPYDVTIRYQSGAENPADYLSRHPCAEVKPNNRQAKVAEEFVNYIAETSTPRTISLTDVKSATQDDATLQAVIEAVQTGKWYQNSRNASINTSDFQSFEKVKEELCTQSDLVLRGHRIVVPESLRMKMVDIAHEGHMGMCKTKALIREKVWFPKIDRLVEEKVKSCLACQVTTPRNEREPLQMSELPRAPWTEVSIDFGLAPTGSSEYLLVVVDDYSRFPVVELVRSTSANAVIPCLDKVFSEYGIPEVVQSDNGPPFNSRRFKEFSEYWGFHHRKVTPYWPRANGEVERFMRTIKKVIKAAVMENQAWKQEMHRFLRNYRATPHASTKVSPATSLFGRPIKTRLPQLGVQTGARDESMCRNDELSKFKMKSYADMKSNAKRSKIEEGDSVLLRNDFKSKRFTPYDPRPYEVVGKKGSMVTAARDSKLVTRNSSFFKPIIKQEEQEMECPEIGSPQTEDRLGESSDVLDVQGTGPETIESVPPRYPKRVRKPPDRYQS